MKLRLKRDYYRKSRGGYSRILDISCSNCRDHLLLYQKDGSGIIKRLYFDRIFEPEYLSKLQEQDIISNIENLVCRKCKSQIGTPFIYKKENRKAFRIVEGSFTKKIHSIK